jgi:GH43 family beta-xylosidase
MEIMITLIILMLSCLLSCEKKGSNNPQPINNNTDTLSGYFTNPLKSNGNYADPWVIKKGSMYYYCGSDGGIFINVANKLQNIVNVERHYIFVPADCQSYSKEIWAPELHFLRGHWYVYFAADDGNNENHRMYVLEGGSNADDPLKGDYSLKGKLCGDSDNWAIDGTAFEFRDSLYFVWSGWPGEINVTQCLYISRMKNPYTLDNKRYQISCPQFNWETIGIPTVNEGPEVLISNSTVNIIYSASGSWTNDYCLGRITCNNGNLLNEDSWDKVGPVFSKTDNVFGPGHASFVFDGNRWWIVYHAAKYKDSGWNRNIRIQPFTWNDSIPVFGKPVSPGIWIQE